ncbi:sodium- and chloride-dependent glycine transporter 1-like isoform X7 [Scylla paramamosain]|uniref:sodium- and chloride-dependent glycine transporter 1-like isoform X7 n=1 Tax=Scylla paramamosain TaxID=85552 RepID=UPI0030839A97
MAVNKKILNISSPVANEETKGGVERENWKNPFQFFFYCLGYAIGFGNVWRFPYLCYKNGGGCYYEEGAALCRNQSLFFFNHSCLSLEDYCGLEDLLPFNETHCQNSANTSLTPIEKVVTRISASEDFFRNRMLRVTGSTWEDMGDMQWELVGLMALSCVIVGICLSRGIKTTGNIVYFTAIFPYAVMFILFIRGITLEGAYKGLEFYILKPNMTRLTEVEVWCEAAVQIFFSTGICFGSLITLSSYNKFTNNCMRDAFVVTITNCSTSVFFGVVIFSVLGFLANEMGVNVNEVAASGSGLAFVVYPAAISLMPIPQLWSVLFFLMLINIGFGTQFSTVEAVTTAIVDQFESLRKRKPLVVMGTCISLFLMGLSMCLQGGIYMLEVFVFYSAGVSVLIICILQLIAVIGIFGFRNLLNAVEEMKIRVRLPLRIYWGVTWLCLTPASLIMALGFLVTYLSMLQVPQASTALHVKPGALTTHLGEVTLIEDVLLVRYPFSTLFSVPSDLDTVSKTLDNSLQELESLLADETHGQTQVFSQTIIKALTARVEFLHGKLNQSQHDYNLLRSLGRGCTGFEETL